MSSPGPKWTPAHQASRWTRIADATGPGIAIALAYLIGAREVQMCGDVTLGATACNASLTLAILGCVFVAYGPSAWVTVSKNALGEGD
jgi:hypothetical protein